MRWHKPIRSAIAVLGAIFLSACAGGGSSSSQVPQPSLPPQTLEWSPPQYFNDGNPLVPVNDLKYYEIYVKQDPSFGPDDKAIATAPPAATTFNLATLSPPLSKGVIYYASVRAVPVEGEKSDFSSSASFSSPK